ncbi:nitroreductase family protein [Desulfococcaceae bacterium HSG9]|nr:nitroreductase family protein [Desulfococcaceae bacterium HSG9]
MIADLIRRNRSYRRFYQNHPVDGDTLEELVNLARLSPSAANLQPLKYILAADSKINAQIFECLAWAAYLKDWPGPQEGERPSAYIAILADTTISKTVDCDHGIACQSILLGAREIGLGGCIIASINREKLRNILKIDSKYKIMLVIALGKPREEVVIEAANPDDSIKYWRDDKNVHHVPKKNLNDIILATYTN